MYNNASGLYVTVPADIRCVGIACSRTVLLAIQSTPIYVRENAVCKPKFWSPIISKEVAASRVP